MKKKIFFLHLTGGPLIEKEKKILIQNRLIFDNDEIRPIKIKRLF